MSIEIGKLIPPLSQVYFANSVISGRRKEKSKKMDVYSSDQIDLWHGARWIRAKIVQRS